MVPKKTEHEGEELCAVTKKYAKKDTLIRCKESQSLICIAKHINHLHVKWIHQAAAWFICSQVADEKMAYS
ncbi:hypothetical protein A2318_00215 [Candidatus Uhrbacteria bacterium RIFOXYB2_FULL_45_11]|uniref:Uncharacterized protein n=1 Tax=Candidatus Uhrbacteria bacterium RIFOXYB2_FULL_45_11 TaxID=1802421 RepID=A0A1F7W902_9BACT|nr:MAG: hypothetical protein A2318_00215 [Candidatus Uhrbacteria bacterium RIFOXYB2_FULL_45_11]